MFSERLIDANQYNPLFSSQVPKEKRLLPVTKVVENTEEQEKRSVNLSVSQ